MVEDSVEFSRQSVKNQSYVHKRRNFNAAEDIRISYDREKCIISRQVKLGYNKTTFLMYKVYKYSEMTC